MNREDQVIRHLHQCFPKPLSGLGIGDDCAVIPLDERQAWLISTDALVDHTHFDSTWISPEQLAHKTLMVNISDIAAMGGAPRSLLLNLGLPEAFSGAWVERFLSHLSHLLKPFDIYLLGGDTVSAQQLFVNLTIIGTAPIAQIKYRHGGQAGDIIAITKPLGGSYAGLQLLLQHWHGTSSAAQRCIDAHLTPQAQLAEGLWLSQHRAVHAMMDLSDGLSCDVAKLCEASRVGAELHLEQVPIDADAYALAVQNHASPLEVAYCGAEDYGLLVSIDPQDFAAIARAYHHKFKQDLTPIGIMTAAYGQLKLTLEGQAFTPQLAPFQHF
jgi:thiamine-monophosphate kinase